MRKIAIASVVVKRTEFLGLQETMEKIVTSVVQQYTGRSSGPRPAAHTLFDFDGAMC